MAIAEDVVTKARRQLNEELYALRTGYVYKLAEVVSLGKIDRIHKRHVLPGLKSVATSSQFGELFIGLEEKIAAAYASLPYEVDVIQKSLLKAKPAVMRKLIEDESEPVPEPQELLDWFSAIKDRPKQIKSVLQGMLAQLDRDFDPDTHDILTGALCSLERVLNRISASTRDAERLKVLGYLREHIDSPLLLERGSTMVTEAEVAVAKRGGREHSARLYLLSNCMLVILAHDKSSALYTMRKLGRAITRAVGGGGGGSSREDGASEGSAASARELPDGTTAGGASGARSRRVFHDCISLLHLRVEPPYPDDEEAVPLAHCPPRGPEFPFDVVCKNGAAARQLREKIAAQVAVVHAQEAEAKSRCQSFREWGARPPSAPPPGAHAYPGAPGGSPYASTDALYSGLSPRGSGGGSGGTGGVGVGADKVDAVARRLAAAAASASSSTATVSSSISSSAASFRPSRPLPPVPPCPPPAASERITAYSPATMLPPRPPGGGPATPAPAPRYVEAASPGSPPSLPRPTGRAPLERPSEADRAAESMMAVCGAIRRGGFALRCTPNKTVSMCRRDVGPPSDDEELSD
eukprot:tig00000076_g2457.t1